MSEDGIAQLGTVLRRILDLAHTVAPDELPSLAHAPGEVEGLRATELFFADYSGRRLVRFDGVGTSGALDPPGSLPVDGTVAGRCFVQGEPIEIAHETGHTLYVPLVDGIDRIGVAQFELETVDEDRRLFLEWVAALIATETVTRGQYTDAIATARRLQAMSLPAELQWSLLPPSSFATTNVRVAAALEPAYQVAGDAYDYAYNNGKVHAAIFDAMGHDLPATMICGLVVGAYRNARRRGSTLLETARYLDRVVSENIPDSGYATALLAELETETGEVALLNAGHPPPLLLRDGNIVGPVNGGRYFPLGLGDLSQGSELVAATIRLQPDDRLLVYSDGIVDAHTAGGTGFGVERLGEFVHLQLASGLSDVEITRRLIHAVVDHFGGRLGDDATVILLHWEPESPAPG
jgi:serine phosphatase RsbU (regulator of sigma subunit)